jgi:acetyl-CoA carboxylase biotin carboxyl carrier protein
VEAGDRVEEGQVLGLIEAMKVFSEIPAEVAGTIHEFTVQNAEMVQHGDVLLYVVPD